MRLSLGFALLSMLLAPDAANSTSIIIYVMPDHIIMAADSRIEAMQSQQRSQNSFQNPLESLLLSQPTLQSYADTECKVVPLNAEILFASTGSTSLHNDKVAWAADKEAIKAYKDTPDHDLLKVANLWAARLSDNFTWLYSTDFQTVTQIADRAQGLLVEGIFAGKTGSALTAYVATVTLNPDMIQRFSKSMVNGVRVITPRQLPYSTHSITAELIGGDRVFLSSRESEANSLWQTKSQTVEKAEQYTEWLRFLIDQTSQYDFGVGGPVNVAELTLPGSLRWLRNPTCKR